MKGMPPRRAAASSVRSSGLAIGAGDRKLEDSGIGIGKLGFEVADVGGGGRPRRVVVNPGIRSATTLLTLGAFCTNKVNRGNYMGNTRTG